MSDALAANRTAAETIEVHCLAHGQRYFSDIETVFPQHCARVLQDLKQVFDYDAHTRRQAMTPEQRLAYHQHYSEPIMTALKRWLEQQLHDREVEPNSSLGKALAYLLGHWTKLTQFLRIPGAPIDNNIVEVRFVGPKPNLLQVRGMGPEPKRGNNLWFENLIPV